MEPASARKLLERAREAPLARAKANRLELAPWLDDGGSRMVLSKS